jgi:putative nucleotidyltransferase with HDIG domain
MDHFHRAILSRILLAWIVLSILTVGAAGLLGIRKFDRMAESLALADARRFAPGVMGVERPGPESERELRDYARQFIKHNCMRLRVFGPDGRILHESDNPDFAALQVDLAGQLRDLPADGGRHLHRFELQGRPAAQLRLPLENRRGLRIGSFEMVLLLDPGALAEVRSDLRRQTLWILLSVTATALLLYPLMHAQNRKVLRFADEVIKGNLEIASVLGEAIAQRDSDTGEHNFRVTLYAVRLAEALGVDQVDLRALLLGAFLHDVGKIGISDNILLKPGRLDDAEFAVMRTHVSLGVRIIESSHWLQAARDVIEFHHEKFDGQGYLQGLKGEEIPMAARIFAVVDVFDALTSRRPYKEPFPFEDSLAVIEAGAGSHFDPRLVAAFRTIAFEAYRHIHQATEAELKAQLRAAVAGYRVKVGLGA